MSVQNFYLVRMGFIDINGHITAGMDYNDNKLYTCGGKNYRGTGCKFNRDETFELKSMTADEWKSAL